MRLIVLIAFLTSMYSTCFGQEKSLYHNLHNQFFLLRPSSFQKITVEDSTLASFESKGFDHFTSADVSNPHYVCIFSEWNQKIWILDNELALFEEINLKDKYDFKVSSFFQMNRSLYLYSEEERSWYIYDFMVNQTVYSASLSNEVDEVLAFSGCDGDVIFLGNNGVWTTDNFNFWSYKDWSSFVNIKEECYDNSCNQLLRLDSNVVLVNPICGQEKVLKADSIGEISTISGEIIYYFKDKRIQSIGVKLIND